MAEGSKSLITSDVKCKVSTVLNNKKQYKKENMFDKDDETCWHSGPVSERFFVVRFMKEDKN